MLCCPQQCHVSCGDLWNRHFLILFVESRSGAPKQCVNLCAVYTVYPTRYRTQLAGKPLLRVATIRRTTDTFLFISHTTNVLLFKFRWNIFIGVRIIKEMLGSIASGTHCIWRHVLKLKLKPVCGSFSTYAFLAGMLYSYPNEFLHSSPEALHTRRRERPLSVKEGTISEFS
jgi:hypothetical protein